MASLTLKGLPDELKERIEKMADRERRSLNQQAIYLLERAVREEPSGFEGAYRCFREKHGTSPLEASDLGGLRGEETGREVDL
jgi:predicted transcriptional regulator